MYSKNANRIFFWLFGLPTTAGSLGYDACFQNKWFYGWFPGAWNKANITFLEFFPFSACPRNMGSLMEESLNGVLYR